MKMIKSCGFAAILLSILVSVTATAGGVPEGAPTQYISFADLNLGTAAGVAALYRRIEHTADQVCELPRETRRLRVEMELKACKVRATTRAVQLINLPVLTSLHAARTGIKETPAQIAKGH